MFPPAAGEDVAGPPFERSPLESSAPSAANMDMAAWRGPRERGGTRGGGGAFRERPTLWCEEAAAPGN